jgi:hypothetical protein
VHCRVMPYRSFFMRRALRRNRASWCLRSGARRDFASTATMA